MATYAQAGNPTVTPAPVGGYKTPSSPQNTMPPAQASSNQPTMAQMFQGTAQFRPPPQPMTFTNPNIPGQPFMGPNAQAANTNAQHQAGVAPLPPPQATTRMENGQLMTQGANGQWAPVQQVQAEQKAGETVNQQSQQTQQQPTVPSIPQTQQPTQPTQAVNQIAPQALLPQTQIAQQNAVQSQPQTFQQPQVGGYPVQQTQPNLPQTGSMVTPQTVTDPSQQPAPQIDPSSQVQAFNNSTGQTETVSPDDPRFASGQLMQNPVGYQTGQTTPQNNIVNALQSNSQQDFNSMLQNAMQAGPNTSGAALLKLSLQQQLGAIDDPNINTYLNNQIARTQQAYEMGMGYNSAQSNELQEAIAGTLTDPQTLVGVQAKQAQAAKDLNLQSLQAQKDWNTAQQAATTDQLQTKRSDLEGFLKAQMALSAGSDTAPSTAALTVMSQSLHEADVNMTLQNAGYTFGQNQLSIQGSQVMTDYTNQVMQLGAQVNQQRMQVTSDYYSGLNQIDQNALANEQQKRQLTSQAYGDYAQKMLDLNNNEANRQIQYAQLAHTTLQDYITDANNISGTTGYVYQPDGKGGFQQALDENGNPIQTLQAKQNQFTNANAAAQLGLQAWNDNAGIIKNIADQAINSGALPGTPGFAQYGNAMEQLVGAPPGSISSIQSVAGLNQYIDSHISGSAQSLTQIADGTKSQIPDGINKIFNVGGKGGRCGDFASTLSTATHVLETWNQRIQQVRNAGNIQDNPQPGFKMILPLGVNTDGQEPGHVETVISYDPKTQNMLLAQSNMDLKGTISMDIQNIGQIRQKYGNNWGFLPGQLKPGVQSQLNNFTSQNGSQITVNPPGQVNWDALGASFGGGSSLTQNNALYATKLANGDMTIDQIKSAITTASPAASSAILNQIVSAAAAQNPNFSEGQSQAKADFLKGWTGASGQGSMGYINQTAQTALGHLQILYNAFQSMGNSGFKDWNGAIQYAAAHGDDPALAAFNAAIDPVSGELGKAMTGGVPGETEMADLAKQFSSATSPQAMQAIVKTYAQLEGEKIQTNINAYKENVGHLPPESIFTSDNADFMNKLGLDPTKYDPTIQTAQSDQQGNVNTGTGSFASSIFNKFSSPDNTDQSKAQTTFNLTGSQGLSPLGNSIQQAQKTGYSSQDVYSYLKSHPAVAPQILAAEKAGYSPDQILNYYNQ